MTRRSIGILLFLGLLLPCGLWAQEGAVIRGKVTDEAGMPLPGVSVRIEQFGRDVMTDEKGAFALTVPAQVARGQTVTLVAQSIGYKQQTQSVTLSGGVQTVSFALPADVLNLEGVVVTGVASETPRQNLAFSVGQVKADQLELVPPSTSPVKALAGRVPGVQVVSGNGTPGEGVSVRLRGTTSVEGNSTPLYIVDGVILAAGQVDIESQDIESMEVVKGAAASSIYGSRAQNGVIQITTKRGKRLSDGQTRITARTEMGVNQIGRSMPRSYSHIYMVAEEPFTDALGNQVQRGDWLRQERVGGEQVPVRTTYDSASVNFFAPGIVFQDRPYPGPTYDHIKRFFQPGSSRQNFVSLAQRNGGTNFRVSFGNVQEQGVVESLRGYTRYNGRVNLDHRINDRASLSITGYLADANRDDPIGAINPFATLYLIDPQTDLGARDARGKLIAQPDGRRDFDNPLYVAEATDIDSRREHILGNMVLRYAPIDWLNLEGALNVDRVNFNEERFFDKGFESLNAEVFQNGRYIKTHSSRQSVNANLMAMVNRSFGELTTRTKANFLVERDYLNSTSIRGDGFAARGVRDLENISDKLNLNPGSIVTDARGVYAFLATQMDFRDRYVADFLVRRDGSSLFGVDERWHTYFRASGAYRMSQESWWPFAEQVPEFKLRYSYGTAGAQPGFAAQYESYGINAGKFVKATLGNRFLKPELQTEQEAGVNFTLFDRVSAEVVYAHAVIEDQLLRVPLPSYAGYNVQWRNAGTIKSNTWEATVETALLRQPQRTWTLGLIFDRTRQRIAEFDLPPFRGGPNGAFEYREGEELGAIYGHDWVRSVDQLPEQYREGGAHFQVNDDGYLVAVGEGNSWKDGISKKLWGSNVDVDGDGSGDYEWGMPIKLITTGTNRVKIGSSTPDFNFGVNSMFRWKGLSAFMLWNAQVGGEIYNNARQRAYAGDARAHGDLDQSGKSQATKKPLRYYETFYMTSSTTSYFIEDGTYMKLRELSLSYDFNRERLRRLFGDGIASRVYSMNIGVIGRNLLTLTDYTGFDPEVGLGDATLIRYDNFGYPNYRTFTTRVELQF